MSENGLSVGEYLELKKRLKYFKKYAIHMTESNYNKLHQMIDEVTKSSATSKAKGTKFEDVIAFLLDNIDIFNVYQNIRSSTNEMDLVIELTDIGKSLFHDSLIDLKGERFIIECKNYDKKIDVTWVGKFYSLINTSNTRLGILISNKGFKGRGKWDSAKGLAKKFYYAKEKSDEKIYILDITLKELLKLGPNLAFSDLVLAKINELELDTKYEHFIDKHDAELLLNIEE